MSLYEIFSALCQVCDGQSSASKLCLSCSLFECDACFEKIHSISAGMRKHQSLPLLKSGLLTEHESKCEEHGKDINFFCDVCHRACCLKCMSSSQHAGHTNSFRAISDWNTDQLISLKARLAEMESLLVDMEAIPSNSEVSEEVDKEKVESAPEPESQKIDEMTRLEEAEFGELEDAINDAFKDLEAILEHHKALLLGRVEAVRVKRRASRVGSSDELKKGCEWLRAVIQDANSLEDVEEVSFPLAFSPISDNIDRLNQIVTSRKTISHEDTATQIQEQFRFIHDADMLKRSVERFLDLEIDFKDNDAASPDDASKNTEVEYEVTGIPGGILSDHVKDSTPDIRVSSTSPLKSTHQSGPTHTLNQPIHTQNHRNQSPQNHRNQSPQNHRNPSPQNQRNPSPQNHRQPSAFEHRAQRLPVVKDMLPHNSSSVPVYKADGVTYQHSMDLTMRHQKRHGFSPVTLQAHHPHREEPANTKRYSNQRQQRNPQPSTRAPGSTVNNWENPNMDIGRVMNSLKQSVKECELERSVYLRTGDRVTVTYLLHPEDFYVQKVSDAPLNSQISDLCQSLCDQNRLEAVDIDKLKSGCLLIGFNENENAWQRVRVLPNQTSPSSGVDCHLVDRGGPMTFQPANLFDIPPPISTVDCQGDSPREERDSGSRSDVSLLEQPPLVFHCNLAQITSLNSARKLRTEDKWGSEVTNVMMKYTYNKVLISMVTGPPRPKYSLFLFIEENLMPVRDLLIHHRLAVLPSDYSLNKKWRQTPATPLFRSYLGSTNYVVDDTYSYLPAYPIQNQERVLVCSFILPRYFYVQSHNPSIHEKILALQQALHVSYSTCMLQHSFPATMRPVKGMPVAAQFSDDNKWYRARIQKVINPTEYNVQFVDYGNSETLPISKLRRLFDGFLKEPIFATCCVLANCPIPDEDIISKMRNSRQFLCELEFTLLNNIFLVSPMIDLLPPESLFEVGVGIQTPLPVTLQDPNTSQLINDVMSRNLAPLLQPHPPSNANGFDLNLPPLPMANNLQAPVATPAHTNNIPTKKQQKTNVAMARVTNQSPVTNAQDLLPSVPQTRGIPSPIQSDKSGVSSNQSGCSKMSSNSQLELDVSIQSGRSNSQLEPNVSVQSGRSKASSNSQLEPKKRRVNTQAEEECEHLLDLKDDEDGIEDLPDFRVTAFYSPHHFYMVSIAERKAQMKRIRKYMGQYFSHLTNKARPLDVWKAGTFCAVQDTRDLAFCRGQLIANSHLSQPRILVLLVDVGEVLSASPSHLYTLPPSLAAISPPLALRCSLPGVMPSGGGCKWSQVTRECGVQLLDRGDWKVKVVGMMPKRLPLEALMPCAVMHGISSADHAEPNTSAIDRKGSWAVEIVVPCLNPHSPGASVFKNFGLWLADKGVALRDRRFRGQLSDCLVPLTMGAIVATHPKEKETPLPVLEPAEDSEETDSEEPEAEETDNEEEATEGSDNEDETEKEEEEANGVKNEEETDEEDAEGTDNDEEATKTTDSEEEDSEEEESEKSEEEEDEKEGNEDVLEDEKESRASSPEVRLDCRDVDMETAESEEGSDDEAGEVTVRIWNDNVALEEGGVPQDILGDGPPPLETVPSTMTTPVDDQTPETTDSEHDDVINNVEPSTLSDAAEEEDTHRDDVTTPTPAQPACDEPPSSLDEPTLPPTPGAMSGKPKWDRMSSTSTTSSVMRDTSRAWLPFPVPPQDKQEGIEVYVFNVTDQMIFYCSPKFIQPRVEEIERNLALIYSKKDSRSVDIEILGLEEWKVGDSCVVNKERKWRRGLVMEIDLGFSSAKVLLIDSGEMYEVISSLMRPLIDFASLLDHISSTKKREEIVSTLMSPPCLYRCLLHNIHPLDKMDRDNLNHTHWDPDDVKTVRSWFVSKRDCFLSYICTMEGLSPATTLAVRLTCPSVFWREIGDELCSRDAAYRYDKSYDDEVFLKSLWRYDNYLPLSMPPPGIVCPVVVVSAVEQFNEWYVQFFIDQDQMTAIQRDPRTTNSPQLQYFLHEASKAFQFLTVEASSTMQTHATISPLYPMSELTSVDRPACLAFYQEDDSWCRGEVSGYNDTLAVVDFVDYGNSAPVALNFLRRPIHIEKPACCRKVFWSTVTRHPVCTLPPQTLRDTVKEKQATLPEILYMVVLKDHKDGRLPEVDFFLDQECREPLVTLFEEDQLFTSRS